MSEEAETPIVSESTKDAEMNDSSEPNKSTEVTPISTPATEPSAPEICTNSSSTLTSVSNTTTTTSSASSNMETSVVSAEATKSKPLSPQELDKNWEDLGVHRCPVCKFTTDQEELFKNHTTSCSASKITGIVKFSCVDNQFTCHACNDTTWSNQSEFEEHIVIHIQNQPYVCLSCKKDFSSRRKIELHVKLSHPNGVARSGLRGMKKGRKHIQDLLENGSLSIQGKLNVPKTPHNKSNVSQKQDDASDVSIDKVSPAVDISQENTLEQVVDDPEWKKEENMETNRPMPPPRTSSSLVLGPNMVNYSNGNLVSVSSSEQAKKEHLNSLFGEFNTSNNLLQPTYVSQKIRNIANPTGTVHHKPISPAIDTKLSPTQVAASVAKCSYTTSSQNISPSLSINAPQQIILLPVGNPVPVLPNLQRMLVPSSSKSQNVQVQLKPVSPAVIPGNQSVASDDNLSTPIVSDSNRQPLSIPPNVGASSDLISLLPKAPQLGPPSPYPVSSALGVMPLQSNSSAATTIKALQNIADLVCPAKRAVPNAAEASGSIQHQSNQFINLSTLIPQLSAKAPVPSSGTMAYGNMSSETKNSNLKKGTKFLFKRDAKRGMVCEVCKKFTKEEFIFRKHVWDHFHNVVNGACKKCSPKNIQDKVINQCQIVNGIVASLERQSRQDVDKQSINLEQTEVIDITDDDNNLTNKNVDKQKATEVIVLDDEEEDTTNGGLQIQITSAFSLTSNSDLEQMSKDPVNSFEVVNNQSKEPSINNQSKEPSINNRPKEPPINNQSDEPPSLENVSYGETNTLDKTVNKKYPVLNGLLLTNQQCDVEETKDKETHQNTEQLLEADDDNFVKSKELLDKSLSEPNNDSESIVSNFLETNLKEFDPTKKVCDETTVQTSVPGAENNKDDSVVKQNQSGSTVAYGEADGKHDADKDILTNQGHLAFYVCGYEDCSFKCFLSSKYKQHLKSAQHEKEYNYICGHCGHKDYMEDAHVRHVFSHASAKSFILYKCPIRPCKYKTNSLHLYNVHLKAHPNEELVSIRCNYCNKTFPKIEDLEEHLKKNLLKFVACPQCSFKFGDRSVVMKHMKDQHPDRLRYVTVTSQIVCNEREINFYVYPPSGHLDPSEPELHSENLDIPMLLDKIDGNEDENKKVSEEQTPVHVGSENEDALSLPEEDQCDIKRNAGQPKNQKVEKSNEKGPVDVTVGPKHLLCKHCTYLSYNHALYLQHLSLHEAEPNREKKFICNCCPLSTDNIASFRKHMKNHTGKNQVKLLTCTACSYCTNQKCHIMDHIRDAHPTPAMYTMSVESIQSNHYECRFCDFQARTLEQIDSHETYVHSDTSGPSGNKPDLNTKLSGQTSDKNEESATKKKLKYHCEYCHQFFKHKVNLKEHLSFGHSDIENKQFVFFKCKYCPYTSTMKERIFSHIGKEHKNMEVRILRKIESIESKSFPAGEGEINKTISASEDATARTEVETENAEEAEGNKTEVVIPDGNIFKQPFKCPECEFSSNTRLKTMMHLKYRHPELKPVRPSQDKTAFRKIARKSSTSSLLSSVPKTHGALIQDIPETAAKNPFTAVKEAVVKSEPAVEHQSDSITNPSSDHYTLGEQNLHSALSACFIPSEQDMNFQCRICKQKIFKKFVLHRHILNHLNVVFFQCSFCEEGSIERTLMVGHIQKCHPQLPILYSTTDKAELQSILKEKIFSQNFNDIVGLQAENVPIDRGVTGTNRVDIVKKPVHEYQTIEDSDEETLTHKEKCKNSIESQNEKAADNVDMIEEKFMVMKTTKGPYKCTKCRYVTHTIHHYNMHVASHNDPNKKYTCSVCDFRGTRFSVLKHTYSVFHSTQPHVNHDDEDVEEDVKAVKVKEIHIVGGERTENIPMSPLTASSDRNSEPNKGKKGHKVTKDNQYAYRLKTVFKCKECGEKRESRTSIYEHFKISKCNKSMYKCSLCSFTNKLKSVIKSHAQKRHHGKKFTIMSLPINTKFRTITVPVRLTEQPSKLNTRKSVNDSSSLSSCGSVSPVTVEKDQRLHCQICSTYVCQSLVRLQFHINTYHSGVKLQCKTCSYKTPLVQHMLNHCRNVHRHKVAQYGIEKVSPSNQTNKTEVAEVQDHSNSGNEIEFRCPKCSKKFRLLKSVQAHLYIHFKYKPYKCRYCNLSSARSAAIRMHIEKCHPGKQVKTNTEKIPEIEAKMQKIYHSVKLNVARQRNFLGLSRPSKLDNYELVEKGVRHNGDKFYCDICNFSAPKKFRVKEHLLKVHRKRFLESDSDSERFSPPRKVIKLENPAEASQKNQGEEKTPLRYKVIKTQGVKKLQCLECDYQTENINYMKQHKRRSHEIKLADSKSHIVKSTNTKSHDTAESRKDDVIGKTYNCYYCNYTSLHSSSDIRRHQKVHHSSKPIRIINKMGMVLSEDGRRDKSSSPARSSLSSSPARSLSDLYHDSPIKPSKKVTGSTMFFCNMCHYSTKGIFHFRLHLLKHKEFTQLTTKMDIVSQLSCGFCSYVGKNMFELNAHVATHMAEMQFKCAYCNFTHFHCAKVNIHLKHAHSDRPELVVDKQKKKFTDSALKLVNMNPVLKLQKSRATPASKKRFRRIRVESSDESDVEHEDLMNLKKGMHKSLKTEDSETEDDSPQVHEMKPTMKIMTSRAASVEKKHDVEACDQADNTEDKMKVDEAPESEKAIHVKSVVHSEKFKEGNESNKDEGQDETNEISENVQTELVKVIEYKSGRDDDDDAKTCKNELDKELNEIFQDVDSETQVYESETQGFDAEEVAKFYNEEIHEGDEADKVLFNVSNDTKSKVKNLGSVTENVSSIEPSNQKRTNINSSVEGMKELNELSIDGHVESVNSGINKNDAQFNKTTDVDNKMNEDPKEENVNVFEKFTADLDVNSDVNKQNNCNDEDSNHGTDANIFEKFNQNQMEDADSAVNDVSKNIDIEEDESDKNIFDKFEFVNEEMNEKDKESDISEEENIFDKFTKTGKVDNSGSKSIEPNPDASEKNFIEEVPVKPASETKKVDQSVENGFENVDKMQEEESDYKEIVNRSGKKDYEDMEVAELNNSIEDNMKENSQFHETKEMDTA